MPIANASSIVTVTGSATGRVLLRATAPGLVPEPWIVEPTDNGAFITNFPRAPELPLWSVSAFESVATVNDFPRFFFQETPIINVTMSGRAGGRTRFQGRRIVEALNSANGGTLIDFRRSE